MALTQAGASNGVTQPMALAHGEQSLSADTHALLGLKGLVSPSSPFCGIILQVHPVCFFGIWLKYLAAPQVKPGGTNNAICPFAAYVAISLISKEPWKKQGWRRP